MNDFTKGAFLVILVVAVDMLLCLIVPTPVILEFLLILVAILLITAGVSLLNDLIHYHKVQQALREIELEKQRRQSLPSDHNQASASHHHDQAHSRRLRGGRCRW